MINFFSDKKFIYIIFVGIILRFVSISLFADAEVDNEWGIMLNNLETNKILSVRSVNDIPVPNIFMPPLYPLFLYIIKIFFNNLETFLKATFIVQFVLSVITIFLSFKIFLELFSKNISHIGAFAFAVFPLNVFAVSQISSITLQLFLLNFFLLSYIRLFKKIDLINVIIFSISSGLLILLRGEFFLFVFLSLIYLQIKQKQIFKILFTTTLIILIISPYLYRNYVNFGVITITKSSGYNLLKGNHPNTKVGGTGMFLNVENVIPETKFELEHLYSKGPIINHDLLKDQILLNQAIKFIKEDPKKYINLYFKKFLSFTFFDLNSNYPNYYSFLHIFPKTILSLTTLIGIILIYNFKISISNYFILFYFANLGLFSFFFILPRYSLSLLIFQLILSLYGLEKIIERFKLKK
jgi:hypothetical protein